MKKRKVLKMLKDYKEHSKYSENIIALGIFGSYARGEDSEVSDIDVFVALRVPKMFDLIGIKQDLQELSQSNIDIVLLQSNMNNFLKKRIAKEGIYA